MKRAELARNLAVSATLGNWSARSVEAALRRRLPDPQKDGAKSLAASLLRDLPLLYAPSVKTVADTLEGTPEFEAIWRFCHRHNTWPDADLTAPRMAPVAPFDALDLPGIPTIGALSDWLFLTPERLDYLADPQHRHEAHDEMAVNHYHYHLHRKTRGGIRLIEAPKPALKALQRGILSAILDRVPAHPDAFGFVAGRNCLQAAARHAGEAAVLRFDLMNFFPSISAGRVFGLFRCLGYPHGVSRMLTALATTTTPPRILSCMSPSDRAQYRQPHLPQGAPTSPALANLVCHALDRRLAGLARKLGGEYTRYADDLNFSGDIPIAAPLLHLVPRIVADEGSRLNAAKTRRMRAPARQTVTGLVVNQHLNVDRRDFDRLKAVIHACGKPEDTRLADPRFRASLLGRIGWVESVNPARGAKLRHLLERSWQRRFSGLPDAPD